MSVQQASRLERAGEIASESRFVQLCRLGFLGRGLLYVLIGLLVIGTGRTEDLTGALQFLNRGIGNLLLMAICAGMAGYGLWRLADAALGVEHPGRTGSALGKRAVAGATGLIYLYLAYKALRILVAGDPAENTAQQQADTLLDLPGGSYVLAGASLVLVAAGFAQLRSALQCTFLARIDRRAATPAVRWLGRIGYLARGIVFLLVAAMIARAALRERSTEAGGMEQALDLLSGPFLYAVAGGLMLFGLFSIIEGLFRRIREPEMEDLKEIAKA